MQDAISHDLQTPIMRMHLRADLLEDEALRDKLQADLGQMHHLVEQGLACARTAQASKEALAPTDLGTLPESIVADRQDKSRPVLDSGPGTPASERDKVTRPFYRIEGSRNPATGGTGLGLAIVRSLVQHCQADLRLEPRDGEGLAASVAFRHAAQSVRVAVSQPQPADTK